jgi:hypothetical protein
LTKVQTIDSKPSTASEKKTHTVLDTIIFTLENLEAWLSPPFQRPIKENDKVRALAEELKENGGIMPGIMTLGKLDGKTYIIDGQHRKAAFKLSGLREGYVDLRIHYVNSMAEMGEEFVKLNSQLNRMKPDDILRGLEPSIDALTTIRKHCPFVGYDNIRRGDKQPILSMSMTLRAWYGSSRDVPSPNGAVMSTAAMAETIGTDETKHLIDFLSVAYDAFGRDREYQRLWAGLNLILCMWLYRRMVISQYSMKTPKLTKEQFKKCLMSLSANSNYVEWLVGRNMSERDRSPAYNKIKTMFAQRIMDDTGKKPYLPLPTWATHV